MKNYIYHIQLFAKRFLLILLLFTLCRILFYLFNFNTFRTASISDLFIIFAGGIRFDVSALMYFNSLFYILHLVPGEFKNNPRYQKLLKIWFLIVNAIILSVNLADVIFFKFSKNRMTAYIFDLFGIGGQNIDADGLRLFPKFIIEYWYISSIWIIMVVSAWYFYPKLKSTRLMNLKLNFTRFSIQFLLFVFSLGVWLLLARGGFQNVPLQNIDALKYGSEQNAALVLNSPFSIMTTFGKKELKPYHFYPEAEVMNHYNPVKNYHEGANDAFTKKNVVIIILESFSKEYIGSLTGDKTYTPFLDSLIGQSKTFSNAYANSATSIEALPAIIASFPSLMENPLITSMYSTNQVSGIAGILKNEGYQTGMFHGATNGSMGFESFSRLAGFERFYGRTEYANDADYDGNWGIFDEPFFQYFSKTLDNYQQPFVASIFSLSSHHPFTVPDKYIKRFSGEKLPILNVIKYTDYALKSFFETAKNSQWYKNTLFVITADHIGLYTEKSNATYIEKYAIPIIYYCPSDSLLIGTCDTISTQQADILPSVLDYLNYPKAFISFGNSVFNPDENFSVNFSNGLFQFLQDDFVLFFDGTKTIGLYEYKTDKTLNHNLKDKHKELTAKYEAKLKAVLQQYNQRILSNQLIMEDL